MSAPGNDAPASLLVAQVARIGGEWPVCPAHGGPLLLLSITYSARAGWAVRFYGCQCVIADKPWPGQLVVGTGRGDGIERRPKRYRPRRATSERIDDLP